MDNLVLSNMFHRPARTLVSIAGIAAGVLLIVFTVGLSNGSIREQASREANVGAEIFVRPSGSIGMSGTESFRISDQLPKDILKVEGIAETVGIGQNSIDVKDSNTGKRLIDGVNFEEYKSISGLRIVEGRPFTDGADEAIIDTGWQQQKKFKLGDTTMIYDRPFTIVGTYEPAGGARAKIPLSVMQKQLGGEGKISSVLVKLAPGASVEAIGPRLQEAFPNNQIIRTEDLEELYMAGFPALNIFLNVIVGVAAVISALVILLTMYTTVTERTRQIGVMKSLGMSNGQIAWTITQEALLLSFFGIVFGVIFTIILRALLSYVITLEVEIGPTVVAIVFVVGMIGGAIGGLYPAMRAARLDAVEALSYE